MLLAGTALVLGPGACRSDAGRQPPAADRPRADLQGSGRLRRGRRARHRRARQLRARSEEGRLPGLRGRQAAGRSPTLRSSTSRSSARERPLFAKQAIEPDVQSNERPFDGRMYVMVLDSAHTLPQNTNLVRRAAKKFIDEKLGANDLMAVVFARGGVAGGDRLRAGVHEQQAAAEPRRAQVPGSAPRSATLNKMRRLVNTSADARGAAPGGPPQDIDRQGARVQRARVLEELTAVADWFASVRGRKKSILLFSEGISYDIHDAVRQRRQQRGVDDPVAHAGSRTRGDQGQRQHLRDRPARPAGAVGRQHRAAASAAAIRTRPA